MKAKILTLTSLFIGLSSFVSYSQCPGTATVFGEGSTGIIYDITVTNFSCGVEGEIDVTIPEAGPDDLYLWSINGAPYVETTSATADIIPATPGTYNFAVINILNSTADICTFEVADNFTCQGDFNEDGIINTADLLLFMGDYGLDDCIGCCGDFDGNGMVDLEDLSSLLAVFGTACPMTPITTNSEESTEDNAALNQTIKDKLNGNINIEIYPNPSVDFIHIVIENLPINTNLEDLVIVDVTGKVVKNVNWNVENSTTRVSVSDLDSGTYFLTLTTTTEKFAQSFIIK